MGKVCPQEEKSRFSWIKKKLRNSVTGGLLMLYNFRSRGYTGGSEELEVRNTKSIVGLSVWVMTAQQEVGTYCSD